MKIRRKNRTPQSLRESPRERPPSPARRVALDALVQGLSPKTKGVDVVLDAARVEGTIDARDLALAQEIAYGVCRHRRWLEQILNRFLHKPLPAGAAKVHEALLMGIYQAIFLDRVPMHAIVDETVRLVRVSRTEKGYHGLANAIMRKVADQPREALVPGEGIPWPVRLSIPDWIASEAGHVLAGEGPEKLFEAMNQPAPLHLRITGGIDEEKLKEFEDRFRGEVVDQAGAVPEIDRGGMLSESLHVRGRGFVPSDLPSFRQGLITVEDEAAQLTGWLSGVKPGDSVLDLCASPGGKTSHIADLMNRTGRLLATDISDAKLERLRETLTRLQLGEFVETRLASDIAGEQFDVVLVDAPCSGLGTLRRHPEIRWRREPKDLKNLAKQQGKLLRQAAGHVRPGGVLVYSVCTFTQVETDLAADRFLQGNGEFSALDAPEGLPFIEPPLRAGPGRWRVWPHRNDGDAFFIARLIRKA